MMRVVRIVGAVRPVRLLSSVSIGLLFGVVAGAYVMPANVVKDITVKEIDGVATRGREIDLLFTLTRLADCDVRVERWAWTWMYVPLAPTDKVQVRVPRWVQLDNSGANPPTKIGLPDKYILTLPLPAAVTPGEWYYWARSRDRCGWQTTVRGENVREGVNIPFTVKD